MDLITMKNVYKTYPNGVGAIYDLSLSIEKGEFVAIVGESGSGKTTIGRAVIRVNPLSKGKILYKGKLYVF